MALGLAALAPAVGAASAAAAAPAAAAAKPAPAPPGGQVFHFALLDRDYANDVPLAETVEQGPFTVELTSPRQSLILRQHRLELRPRPDGSHDATLEVSFVGKGWLVADADLAGIATRLEDELLLPIQTSKVRGRVELARASGGYTVTPRELPASLPVRIESRLVGGLVGWCDTLALLPGSGAACDELETALTTVSVPLPAAGVPFFIADADLRPADREQLEAYLLGAWNASLAGLPRLNR